MERRVIRLLLVAGFALAATSCDSIFEPRDHVYDGPPLVEFAPVLPAGNYTRSVSFPAGSTATNAVNVTVQYIGPPPSSNVSGTFTVGGTAVRDTHYSVASTTYTIAAGSNSVSIPISILGGGLANGQSVSLLLELVPGDVGVSENYKQFTISATKAAS